MDDERDVRQRVQHAAEAILAVSERRLGGLALVDVLDDGDGGGSGGLAGLAQQPHIEVHPHHRAVAADVALLHPVGRDLAGAQLAIEVEIGGEVFG